MMERALRKKFIVLSCGVVFAVLFTMAVVMNVSSYVEIVYRADEIIEMMGANDGNFPPIINKGMGHVTEETPYTTRYFTVKLGEDGSLISTNTRNIQMVDTDDAISFADSVLGTDSGFVKNYRYQVVEQDYGSLLIFVDCTQDITMFYAFLRSSVLVCLTALLGIFLLMVVLSKKAVAPIVESYQKQQQFITNITHELKTPLAIIKTNTEVMEMEGEPSQWSRSIHNQIGRLNELVNYLVSLSKLEEGSGHMAKLDFSLSDAVAETIDGFDLLAESEGRGINRVIAPNFSYCGDEQSIRLLTSILLDNALKYGLPQSDITVRLTSHRERPLIQVENQAEGLTAGKYDMLFERFYRMEHSRNSKLGGFGIGLAMAKSIAKSHGGTATAHSPDGHSMVISIQL